MTTSTVWVIVFAYIMFVETPPWSAPRAAWAAWAGVATALIVAATIVSVVA